MKRKLQVFVSSTYKDLPEERQAAVSAILKAGHIPAGMELFAAGDESQWESIKRWIVESDVYMLILGGRYGSIEPKSQLSYIELEYDYALSLKKPHFAIVVDEGALEERVKEKGTDVLELENRAKLKAFRGKVLSKMSSFFSDGKDVKLAIHESIRDLEARHKMTGWVSGAEVPDIIALTKEINQLTAEKQKQKGEIDTLKKRAGGSSDESEMSELAAMLSRMKVCAPKGIGGDGTEASVLALFYSNRSAFTHGVQNNVGAGESDNWLFESVGAPLEAHGLVESEKVAGAQYRRLVLSKKGACFLAHMDKEIHINKRISVGVPTKGTPTEAGKSKA